jgi:hypothetical protein
VVPALGLAGSTCARSQVALPNSQARISVLAGRSHPASTVCVMSLDSARVLFAACRYARRHIPPHSARSSLCQLLPGSFPAPMLCTPSTGLAGIGETAGLRQAALWLLLGPLGFYLAWQLLYWVAVQVRARGWPCTLFRSFLGSFLNGVGLASMALHASRFSAM